MPGKVTRSQINIMAESDFEPRPIQWLCNGLDLLHKVIHREHCNGYIDAMIIDHFKV
jgi:hypothetical protein